MYYNYNNYIKYIDLIIKYISFKLIYNAVNLNIVPPFFVSLNH